MFAMYRIMVERIALFVKISILKEKNFFGGTSCEVFIAVW